MDASKLYNERDLLMQLQAGDERAFEVLYGMHSSKVYRKILSMVKISDIAEDITQKLFVKVWQKRELIDPEKKFIFYVLQIANNLVYDFYRKIAREQKLMEEVIAVSTELYSHVEEDIISRESSNIIDRAISSLPTQQRLVFTLCKIEGKSYKEVSELLGISVSTVSNHIVQATKAMKRLIFSNEKMAVLLLIGVSVTTN